MKVKSGFALRQICGEYILVPTGENALIFSGMIATNEVGASLWQYLQKECSEQDLLNKILNEFEIDEQTARTDIKKFIDKLVQFNLLE